MEAAVYVGADLETLNKAGWTPLMGSSQRANENATMVQVLIDARA